VNTQQTDAQRGDGVYARSITALQRLNVLGYGRPGGELRLTLMSNPVGAFLRRRRPRPRRVSASSCATVRHRVHRPHALTKHADQRYLEYLDAAAPRRLLQRLSAASIRPASPA